MTISFFWVARVQTPGRCFSDSRWISNLCGIKKRDRKLFEMFVQRRTNFRYTFLPRLGGQPVSLSPFWRWSGILIRRGRFFSLRERTERELQPRENSPPIFRVLLQRWKNAA